MEDFEYNYYCLAQQEKMDARAEKCWEQQEERRLQQHCPVCDKDHALDDNPIQLAQYKYEFRCCECGAILHGYSPLPYDDGVEQVGETDEQGEDHYWE